MTLVSCIDSSNLFEEATVGKVPLLALPGLSHPRTSDLVPRRVLRQRCTSFFSEVPQFGRA